MLKRTTAAALVAMSMASVALAESHVEAPAAETEAPSADTVVATVNGTDITLGHMIVLRAQLPAEYQQLPDETLYNAVLDQLIRQTALSTSMGADLSKQARLALENEERSFRAGEAMSRIAEEAVTDEAIQAAYDTEYKDASPGREYNAAHILLETEDEAKQVVEALEGGADFAELARDKSIGPSGPNGGNLGWFGKGMMVTPFEEAVVALEPGAVSAPVETQFGWHVIKLIDSRLSEVPSLDDVRNELVQKIQNDAIQNVLDTVTNDADLVNSDVEIDPALLKDLTLLDQ